MENPENNPDIKRLLARQMELEIMITDTLAELHRVEEKDANSPQISSLKETLDTLQMDKVDVQEQLKELGI
ncbi:MAG: hypothetical protein WDN47_02340 [Candidatus Doudnabacteria bacterium]